MLYDLIREWNLPVCLLFLCCYEHGHLTTRRLVNQHMRTGTYRASCCHPLWDSWLLLAGAPTTVAGPDAVRAGCVIWHRLDAVRVQIRTQISIFRDF